MLSKIPININKIKQEDLDREILRASIIAELDAINLYEEMANMTDNTDLKAVLLDIAREEKTHVGEFQAMLLMLDQEQVEELKKGREEVEELTGKK
jgi:rubrerythrin